MNTNRDVNHNYNFSNNYCKYHLMVMYFCTSVRHFLGEQLSHEKFYQNLVDCVLSHTILKIS